MKMTSRRAPKSKAGSLSGEWTGDIRAFLEWCARIDDLEAYRAALTRVPPNTVWEAVLRSLRAEIEYRERPSDTAPRGEVVETFLVLDAAGTDLRAAKRRILEHEITRRATA